MIDLEKFRAAEKLFEEESVSVEKAESLITLLGGINPKTDQVLSKLSKSLSTLKNLLEGDLISLSVDNLPEGDEKEKKRKKALILFLKTFRQLQDEVKRVNNELKNDGKGQMESFQKLAFGAKGLLGVITLAAVLIVVGLMIFNKSRSVIPSTPSSLPTVKTSPGANKVKVIDFNGKFIPLDQLTVRSGPDCDSVHYHAKYMGKVSATDGTLINDPGACAFGKVSDRPILEVP